MSDSKDIWSGIDEPVELPDQVRSRLLGAISSSVAAVEDGFGHMVGLDSPRPLPEEMVTKLQATVIGKARSRRGGLYAALSAAAVVILIASATLVATDRGRLAPRRPVGDVSLVAFASAEEFQQYMSSSSLKRSLHQVVEMAGGDSATGARTSSEELSQGLPAPVAAANPRMGEARRDLESASGAGAATGEFSAGAKASAPEGEFSTTNVQEKGVDEPDLVKTDGKVLIAVSSGTLWVMDVTQDQPTVKGSMPLPRVAEPVASHASTMDAISSMPAPDAIGIDEGQMFLDGTRVIHISQIYAMKAQTKVTIVSIADPAKPTITSETKLEGSLVGARMSDGAVRLVLRSSPAPEVSTPEIRSEEDARKAEEEKRKMIKEAKPEDWLPEFEVEVPGKAPIQGPLHSWKEVQRPQEFSGVSMLSVVTLDPANPTPEASVSIVGAGEIVYSSVENLYVTTQKDMSNIVVMPRGARGSERLPAGVTVVAPEDFRPSTQIHKFSIAEPGAAVYRASGEIEGTVLNQFSISEKDGYLRIATTKSQFSNNTTSESFVTVMQEQGEKLVGVGSVGGLGKGEQIYAVRFIGNLGYVVTFRQTDPLYVIDLSDPTRPVTKGELKIPGFSNYLHPVGDQLLLGIGQDADEQGRVKGLQVSLFDVSNPASPKRLHQKSLGGRGSSSQAEFDHHAFLYWPPTGTLVIPVSTFENRGSGFVGALVLKVDASRGFSEPKELSHADKSSTSTDPSRSIMPYPYGPQILRSIVMRQSLITYSSAGLLTNDLDSLGEKGWLPLTR